MATSKRDRQRANREVKRQVEEQQQRRDKMMGRIKRFAVIAVIAVGVVVGANFLWGADDEDPATATTVSVPAATSTTSGAVTSTTTATSTTLDTDTSTTQGTTTSSG
jgi:hypothetical protein